MATNNDKYGVVEDAYASKVGDERFKFPVIGFVVDNADPDEQGRVKAICPSYGETDETPVEDLSWIKPISPNAGTTTGGTRGYGMFNIPQEGTRIMVMCVDGNPHHKFFMGCLIPEYAMNTSPGGRYHKGYGPYDDQGQPIEPYFSENRQHWDKNGVRAKGCKMEDGRFKLADGTIVDPNETTSTETDEHAGHDHDEEPTPNEPEGASINVKVQSSSLIDSIISSGTRVIMGQIGEFGTYMKTLDSKVLETVNLPEEAVERYSRSIDSAVSAWPETLVRTGALSKFPNPVPDVPGFDQVYKLLMVDGNDQVKMHGYSPNIYNTPIPKDGAKTKYSPNTYSWSTPSGNSFTMDDRHCNTRLRIRTQAGHSILMDDSNERIYINTAAGSTWIELDREGMIDIYAAEDVSISSDTNINFFAKESIRMVSEGTINMTSLEETRILSKTDVNMVADSSIRMRAKGDIDMIAMGSMKAAADGIMSLHGKSGGYYQAGMALHLKSDGPVYITGSEVQINSVEAGDALEPSDAIEAMPCTRIPEHEPWRRGYSVPSKADGDGAGKDGEGNENSFATDHTYKESTNDRDRNGKVRSRNTCWRR